jgi:hypothetical protein
MGARGTLARCRGIADESTPTEIPQVLYGALPENFFAVAPSILPTVAESLT